MEGHHGNEWTVSDAETLAVCLYKTIHLNWFLIDGQVSTSPAAGKFLQQNNRILEAIFSRRILIKHSLFIEHTLDLMSRGHKRFGTETSRSLHHFVILFYSYFEKKNSSHRCRYDCVSLVLYFCFTSLITCHG